MAKFAEGRSVQAHPIYLTGDIDIVPRIGIENIEDAIGSLASTHRLWVAEGRKYGLATPILSNTWMHPFWSGLWMSLLATSQHRWKIPLQLLDAQ
jgi:hypothetical protein